SSTSIRQTAAFTLGQISTRESSTGLMDAFGNEDNPLVLAEILEAIGKTAGEDALDLLSHTKTNDPEYQSGLAMTVARFAIRNVKTPVSIEILNHLYDAAGNNPALEKNLAFALWRIRDRDLLLSARNNIKNLILSTDPETRSFAVNAFNAIKNPEDIQYLSDIYNKETDWRVKVNILNSLGSYPLDSVKEYQDILLGLFNQGATDLSDHVKIAALNSIGRVFSQFDFSGMGNKPVKIPGTDIAIRIIGSGGWFHPEVKAAAIDAYAKIMKDDAKKVLFEEFYHSSSTAMDEALIKGFQNFENGDVVRELRDSISAYVMRFNEFNPNTTGEMIPSPVLARVYRAYVETL